MTPEEFEKVRFQPVLLGSPERVLESTELSKDQKVEVLLRWAYDAAEEAVALEEGMPGQESDVLRRVLAALGRLAGIDVEHTGPGKQHGVRVRPQEDGGQ